MKFISNLFKRREKYKGTVKDFGFNKTGDFLVVLSLNKGNVHFLKENLSKENFELNFSTSLEKISDKTIDNGSKGALDESC